MPFYMIKENPVPTPAERVQLLERENLRLQMRVVVLTEALHAAEEELSRYIPEDCEKVASGVRKVVEA